MVKTTKDKILEASAILFSERGIKVTSVDDICRKICISKKTFYQIYPQKEDLVKDCINKMLLKRQELFHKNIVGKNFIEIMISFSQLIHSKRYLLRDRKMDEEIKKYYPDVSSMCAKEKFKAIRDFFKCLCQEGISDGSIRSDFDFESTMQMVSLSVYSLCKFAAGDYPHLESSNVSFRKLVDALENMLVNSMLTEKGKNEFLRLKEKQK